MGEFVDAILQELKQRSAEIPLALETVYLGGGTPSLLSRAHLAGLLEGIADAGGRREIAEWTLEANPSTFGKDKAQAMREGGVTRVSLGVQSLDPGILRVLGRDHDPAAARESFEILRAAGFPVVNVDLMFSVPAQSQDSWRNTLEEVVSWSPDSVSAYNLTYEEDTPFFEKMEEGLLQPCEDRDADMFGLAIDLLGEAGLEQYEISNYAKPDKESLHNRSYWRGRDYLGLGPGAVSTVRGTRWTNIADTARYIDLIRAGHPSLAASQSESIDDEAFRLERLGLELRTVEGIEGRFVGSPDSGPPAQLVAEGLAEWKDGRFRLTREGLFHVDSIAAGLA